MTAESRARIVVDGHVQGVGFRYFVYNRAREIGLTGWVRNRPGGTVEVQAEGARSDIEELVERLRNGPGRVTAVDVVWEEPSSAASADFQILV